MKFDDLVMVDLETTDTEPKHADILEIGMIHLKFRNGFWHPDNAFEKILHTDRTPETQFAKETMSELFKLANETPYQTDAEVRQEVLGFFRSCGLHSPYVYLMGWNVTMLDIPFLLEHRVLELFYRQTIGGIDVARGDFHYRVHEQAGGITLAQSVLGIPERNELIKMAFDAYPELEMPEGKEHRALYDCYKQLRIENGLIRLLRKGPSVMCRGLYP